MAQARPLNRITSRQFTRAAGIGALLLAARKPTAAYAAVSAMPISAAPGQEFAHPRDAARREARATGRHRYAISLDAIMR